MKKIVTLILVLGILATQTLVVCASGEIYFDESEGNDTFNTADSFEIDKNYTYYLRGNLDVGDADTYKITTTTSGKLYFNFMGCSTDCDLLIYDSSKDCIDFVTDVRHKTFWVNLDRGDHIYFCVDSIGDLVYDNEYKVKVRWYEKN